MIIIKFILLIIISIIAGYGLYCDSQPISNQPEIYRGAIGRGILWLVVLINIPLLIWIWVSEGFLYALAGFILVGMISGIVKISINKSWQ